MTTPGSCAQLAQVDDHFAGRTSVAEEARMRSHLLDGCPACHHRYTRLAMLSRVQPGALRAEERLARGLGLRGRFRPWHLGPLLGLVAFCAVLALVLVRPSEDCFASRGPAATARTELLVFRVGPSGSERVRGKVAASDRLAFAYRNGKARRHVFVFGRDEHGHVYWYAPAWTDPRQQPAAPAAKGDGALHEIPDAVAHDYDGTKLDVQVLFTDRAWQVTEIEAVLERAAAAGKTPVFEQSELLHHLYEITR